MWDQFLILLKLLPQITQIFPISLNQCILMHKISFHLIKLILISLNKIFNYRLTALIPRILRCQSNQAQTVRLSSLLPIPRPHITRALWPIPPMMPVPPTASLILCRPALGISSPARLGVVPLSRVASTPTATALVCKWGHAEVVATYCAVV